MFRAWYLCTYRGIAGDLYLVLHIDEKQGIKRDGMNLYSRVDVDYTEAILGVLKKVQPFRVLHCCAINIFISLATKRKINLATQGDSKICPTSY